jgi:hypothetical protein
MEEWLAFLDASTLKVRNCECEGRSFQWNAVDFPVSTHPVRLVFLLSLYCIHTFKPVSVKCGYAAPFDGGLFLVHERAIQNAAQ